MLFCDLTGSDLPPVSLLHSDDHHSSINTGHLFAVFHELRVKQNHGDVRAQLLHLYRALAESRCLRPRRVNLSKVLHDIFATFGPRFCHGDPNGVLNEKAIKNFAVMRIPGVNEILNERFWACALSALVATRSPDKNIVATALKNESDICVVSRLNEN